MTAPIPRCCKQALAFVGAIDRLPLPVKSSPGFLVNRALTPYMLEAMVMLDEKIDKTVIDAAAEKFGMPMGPIELADQVGLDICLACRRHAALEIRRRAAADAGLAARESRKRRTRPQDRQGLLRLEGRQGRQEPRCRPRCRSRPTK